MVLVMLVCIGMYGVSGLALHNSDYSVLFSQGDLAYWPLATDHLPRYLLCDCNK